MNNKKMRYWYVACEDCKSEKGLEPIPSETKPTKCPECESPKIEVNEQFTIF